MMRIEKFIHCQLNIKALEFNVHDDTLQIEQQVTVRYTFVEGAILAAVNLHEVEQTVNACGLTVEDILGLHLSGDCNEVVELG